MLQFLRELAELYVRIRADWTSQRRSKILKRHLRNEGQLTKGYSFVFFIKAIKTFKNWQAEILNSYIFGYSNGFLEGINNTSKVLKRNAYGFKKYEHYKAKVILTRVYRNIGCHLG